MRDHSRGSQRGREKRQFVTCASKQSSCSLEDTLLIASVVTFFFDCLNWFNLKSTKNSSKWSLFFIGEEYACSVLLFLMQSSVAFHYSAPEKNVVECCYSAFFSPCFRTSEGPRHIAVLRHRTHKR